MKRMLWTAAVLTLLVFLMYCGAALAADGVLPGSGTMADPYIIEDAADWAAFAEDINTEGINDDKYYRLGGDIPEVHETVGTERYPFRGDFDGNGYTLNVRINDDMSYGTAPFRYIAGATIRNVTVAGRVTGGYHVSGLVGFAQDGTNRITGCTVSAIVTGDYSGGIVGHGGKSRVIISDCLFNGRLSANNKFYIGGIVKAGATAVSGFFKS